ncbi:HAMP domain-containing sensor histidine kinase [Mycobacteroides abscessus subsp. abscessus]|uniref:sensor histidine kinase n=2 Tax=Mycobacteroides abscessus TaxID=36809 RepID=UPI00037D8308|nr:HAMP domain-containing sensor histidine kinase [Mycobacteroides abscessus]MDO3101108.1 HAMP domain-containing sensor histidine kinase [Mycobacteroides abscessus subsp. abscessus]MDO3185071.1 HAMP domain-containing sensor histidine kinase [Mycobacteroides abscessus subsp. abscessus]MDO3194305.1 HAMP domain-containing sensor histidine kinase [Mycobacteroides abscessus subsp. abscessus]MDO3287500.1 HAMP domain-containing sensor histidine kinase [Mycobacteroides abscessus subsp. abscessus]OLT84
MVNGRALVGVLLGRMRRWCGGIATRSAMVAAAVVLASLMIVGSASVVLLYRSMCADVDGAANARAVAVAERLRKEPADELESVLLATDQRIVAVQVIDASGQIVRRSASASQDPLLSLSGNDFQKPQVGVAAAADDDIRVSAMSVDGRKGRYTVLVGGGIEPIESMTSTVATMLAITAPVVAAVAAAVTYLLVRRSLRSVDEIRARVSEISTSDLSERVPMPGRTDEISALAVTMNEMLGRIEAGHTAQRRFVGDASHELRSPLATVISALEIAQSHPEVFDRTLVQTALLPEAHRMQSLVEDLLLLARADEHGLPMRRTEIDLDDLAGAELTRLKRETSLQISGQLSAVKVTGDALGVARVLRNLADNAARHARTEVSIGVRADADSAYLQVCDDGPGIPAADRDRVFERFVRLDADRSRHGGGSGLGLAIVAEIVAAHKGTISVGDRIGGGTAMTVRLPLVGPAEAGR